MRYEKRRFTEETIKIGGNHYVDCTFERCALEFEGQARNTAFIRCKFTECKWLFTGAAVDTLRWLSILYGTFGDWGKKEVEALFEQVRDGSLLSKTEPPVRYDA